MNFMNYRKKKIYNQLKNSAEKRNSKRRKKNKRRGENLNMKIRNAFAYQKIFED